MPIVEPEILTDGAHDIQTAAAATERVIAAVYKARSNPTARMYGRPSHFARLARAEGINPTVQRNQAEVCPTDIRGLQTLAGAPWCHVLRAITKRCV